MFWPCFWTDKSNQGNIFVFALQKVIKKCEIIFTQKLKFDNLENTAAEGRK